MRRAASLLILVAFAAMIVRFNVTVAAQMPAAEQLAIHRNLGKAFYENPTTHAQAVEEFKKALDLAPDSARERVNYGLALLHSGKTKEGIAELERAQQQDPTIPHTWFNLGITFKKESEYERAIQQLEQMVKLVPNEPISHYNLGYLYKVTNKPDLALQFFEKAATLDPSLAGPHFQLYNTYRAAGRTADADRELKLFQDVKRLQAGAVIPEDLDWSVYGEIYEPIEPVLADAPTATPPALKFEDRQIATGLDAPTSGLSVLDIEGDGNPDLIAWSANGASVFRNGSVPVAAADLNALRRVTAIAPGDFNNDGRADLCVITTSGASLYVNENGAFRKFPVQLPSGDYFAKAVWLDFDHDYDLDLFLLGQKSVLMRNNGTAGFSDQTSAFPFLAGRPIDGALTDLNAEGTGFDLIVTYEDHGGVVYRDRMQGNYSAEPLDALPAGTRTLLVRDINNDGWTDVVGGSPTATTLLINRAGKLEAAPSPEPAKVPVLLADLETRGFADLIAGETVHRNQGRGQFRAGAALSSAVPAALAAADFDGDGKTDVAAAFPDGTLHLLRNQTDTRNSWFKVTLTGVKNMRLAPAARVEVRAGSRFQKQTYHGVPLLFGFPSQQELDAVRITWPNGLVQNEMKQTAGKAVTFREAQRLSGSCPMIFTWNGKNFEFITDVLGVAPLGASAGDGQYFPVDHQEYVQIPGKSLALVNGRYEIRITEELREVAYIDGVKLLAVDHPSEVEIFTDQKFKSPPFPQFRLYGVNRRIYPVAAREDDGRDVLPRLLRRDAAYADGFARDYSGVAEMHHLDLDFGKAAPHNEALLVLSGWVDWADGSVYRGISQERKGGLTMPYLQVKDAQGRWKTVIEDMGIPAGKPKTIVVDLSGKFLSASREVRIVTDLCLYWDEIFLSESNAVPAAVLSPLEAASAELRFRGFSKPTIHPQRKQPETFNYADWMPFSMWNPTPGLYTRYGDVRPLLTPEDNQLLIMGSGDEIRLLFSADRLAPPKPGWRRNFLLLVDGWAKDGDANTAMAQSVEPLPFHGMSGYPYSGAEHFPDDAVHQSYRKEYNTRPALRLLRPLAEISRMELNP